MKKIFLFIAIMSMTLTFAQSKQVDKILDNSKDGVSTVYNDGKVAVSTVYSDIKSLSPKVESAIKSLATELKTTTNALWIILVRQQLIYSLCYLICVILGILSWVHFYYRIEDGRKNNWGPGTGEPTSYHLLAGLTLCTAIFFSTVSTIHFSDMLTGFVNPEFGALKTIVEVATKLK